MIETLDYNLIELHQPAWLILTSIPVLSLLYHYLFARKLLPTSHFDPLLSHWYLNHNKAFNISHTRNVIMNTFFWLFFSLAMSGPEYAETQHSFESTKGDKILVLLDTSDSMNSRDQQLTRLISTKNKLLLLVNKLKHGDQLGIMLFAGSPHLLFPPTNDKQSMRYFINLIKPNLLPVAGTLIDKAIDMAVTELNKNSNNKQANFILLISDGDLSNEEDLLQRIKKLNINTPIYTLAIGKLEDTPIPSNSDDQLWITADNGSIVTSNRNDNILRQISNLTNGKFQILTNTETDLDFLYTNGMKKPDSTDSTRSNTNWIQLYHFFLFVAVIIFFYQNIFKRGH